jgi:hypothetical protein
MTRRFTVGIANANPQKDIALREYFDQIGTWWHWIPNFWLVVTHNDRIGPDAIRDQINVLTGGAYSVVIEVQGTLGWAGWGPSEGPFFNWIRDEWPRN